MIAVGDIVRVRKSPVTFSYEVLALTENRLGAKLVPEYCRNITPQSELDLLEVVKISGFIDRTKRDGRELSSFKEAMSDGWDFDSELDDWDDEDDR